MLLIMFLAFTGIISYPLITSKFPLPNEPISEKSLKIIQTSNVAKSGTLLIESHARQSYYWSLSKDDMLTSCLGYNKLSLWDSPDKSFDICFNEYQLKLTNLTKNKMRAEISDTLIDGIPQINLIFLDDKMIGSVSGALTVDLCTQEMGFIRLGDPIPKQSSDARLTVSGRISKKVNITYRNTILDVINHKLETNQKFNKKNINPSLIAAIISVVSEGNDKMITSGGCVGLMQLCVSPDKKDEDIKKLKDLGMTKLTLCYIDSQTCKKICSDDSSVDQRFDVGDSIRFGAIKLGTSINEFEPLYKGITPDETERMALASFKIDSDVLKKAFYSSKNKDWPSILVELKSSGVPEWKLRETADFVELVLAYKKHFSENFPNDYPKSSYADLFETRTKDISLPSSGNPFSIPIAFTASLPANTYAVTPVFNIDLSKKPTPQGIKPYLLDMVVLCGRMADMQSCLNSKIDSIKQDYKKKGTDVTINWDSSTCEGTSCKCKGADPDKGIYTFCVKSGMIDYSFALYLNIQASDTTLNYLKAASPDDYSRLNKNLPAFVSAGSAPVTAPVINYVSGADPLPDASLGSSPSSAPSTTSPQTTPVQAPAKVIYGKSALAEYIYTNYGSIIDSEVKKYNNPLLTSSLIAGIIAQESKGDPYVISWSGCAGLMQFCAPTARSALFNGIFTKVTTCGCNGKVRRAGQYPCKCGTSNDDRFNTQLSIAAGTKYMNYFLTSFSKYDDRIKFSIAAYNGGEGTIRKAIAATGKSNPSWDEVKVKITWNGRQDDPKVREIVNYVDYVIYYKGAYEGYLKSRSSS